MADGDRARRLRSGAHDIPADVVTRNQRERLVAAVAEACAERGYADVSVADLAARARVSTATFYKLFAGKRECAIEAHRELLGRLLDEVDRACGAEGERGAKVRAGVHTVLTLFAADQPTARLLTVEVLALGPAGAARNAATVEAFASRLQMGREPSKEPLPPNSDWACVAGISMLVGRRVMAGEGPVLSELEEELVALATARD